VKRGFWAHQLVEYILGIAAIAAGAQSNEPLLPCIGGALLVLNAGSTHGPLGAFRLVPRRLHRFCDDVLVVALIAMGIFGGKKIDASGRVVLIGVAIALAFITWRTDYSTRAERKRLPANQRSEAMGRSAGRYAGNAVNMWKNRKGSG
jgi:hypothetical protein